ncbi:hypothetical protein GPK34_07750 [Secundilactobacillus kimchicus]|uniref:hypothetical protein n=1 Tax=Secundilactobacillus kimchicus TaxID=528209 RepID=UPI001C039FB8|nr:hypothetical protein [Secundilactobacillus kimchicus]MBT9671918.1 hypothetical protein [Secundilactobacillus kimchicus]
MTKKNNKSNPYKFGSRNMSGKGKMPKDAYKGYKDMHLTPVQKRMLKQMGVDQKESMNQLGQMGELFENMQESMADMYQNMDMDKMKDMLNGMGGMGSMFTTPDDDDDGRRFYRGDPKNKK